MIRHFFITVYKFCLAFILCIFLVLDTQATSVLPVNMPITQSFADVVEPLLPAVVNISTSQKMVGNNSISNFSGQDNQLEDFGELLEKFGLLPPGWDIDRKERRVVSLGSGFVIDPAGYIVTNNHVISEAEEITVKFNNDKEIKAQVIGYDAKTDLALLKVDMSEPLPYVKIGESDSLRVGDWVIAIGNPFGLGGTVTAGIVSSRARDINAGGLVDNFIQTDAAINRGNSGGPMFNIKGEVVGINTAIISPSMGNVGIGFATPASLAKSVLEQLKTSGKVIRGWLGVFIQPIDDEVAESLSLKDTKGALVTEVSPDSPAAKIGIIPGDIILSFAGKEVTSVKKLPRIVAETAIGKKVEIVYLRKGVKKASEVSLVVFKDNNKDNDKVLSDSNIGKNVFGVIVAKLTADLKDSFSIDNTTQGVIILKVTRQSNWAGKLKKGDVIISVNGNAIDTPETLEKVIAKSQSDNKKSILLHVNRDNKAVFIAVNITKQN